MNLTIKIIVFIIVIISLFMAGIGIGVVFGALILGVARNPSSLRRQMFSYANLRLVFANNIKLFALIVAFLLLYVAYFIPDAFLLIKLQYYNLMWDEINSTSIGIPNSEGDFFSEKNGSIPEPQDSSTAMNSSIVVNNDRGIQD